MSVSGSIYLSGATSTGIVFSGSTSSGLIILTNSGTAARVDIPTRGLIINAVSGTWDGILQAPSLATGTSITTSGGIIPVTIIYKI